MTKYILAITLLMLLGAVRVQAQWIEDPEINVLVNQGIRDTYNLRFEEADAAFSKVVKAHPDHPTGYFLIAMVEWWRILIDIENESRDDRFYDMLDDVIDLCDKRLKKNEKDLAGLFFKGGSIGFKGRLLANRKSWVKAATTGKQALPVVMDAAEVAPDNADLAFGTGIYDYYAAVLPEKYSVLKPLMMFLPEGNRSRGLKELKLAADKGRYANWEAKYFLMQTWYSIENKPSTALTYARELHEEFPANPVFHRYLGRISVKMGNWEGATTIFSDIATAARNGKRGYTKAMHREAQYYLGYGAMLRKEYGTAMKHLVECDKMSRGIDEDPSGFMIMANLRMGMLHDVMNERNYAVKQYDKVLKLPEFNGSRDLAKKYKKSPYSF
jgi:tetratricopeptide (TPR) repeat protein